MIVIRGGQDLVAEELGPLGDALVRGSDQRALRVAAIDELKEAVGIRPLKRQVAHLIDTEQLGGADSGRASGVGSRVARARRSSAIRFGSSSGWKERSKSSSVLRRIGIVHARDPSGFARGFVTVAARL